MKAKKIDGEVARGYSEIEIHSSVSLALIEQH